MNNKKWFSIIEIIIAISIIVLLAVIWINSKKWYDENVSNTKVVADTKTINNALEQYIQENKTLPNPGWNTNYFKIDTSYAHAYEDADTFGVYGSLTEDTIPKQYLDVIPLDPRTHSYYAYGKAKNTNEFEVASIQIIDGNVVSKVIWNYAAENWPYNLIREYNWPNFVYNWSETNFPYNPDELIMIATDKDKNVYREWDTIEIALDWKVTVNWKNVTTAVSWLELFFSDGSVSVLEPNSKLTLNKLNFKGKDNLNTLVQLWLEAWQIWTKATKLNDNSEFEVYTSDSSAAVRWTIFWVTKATDTDVVVLEWEVAILETATTDTPDTIDASGSLEETVKDANWTPVLEDWVEVKTYKWKKIIEKVKVDKKINNHPKRKRLNRDNTNKLIPYTTEVATNDAIISTDTNATNTESTIYIWGINFKIPKYSVDPKTKTEEYKKRIEEFNQSVIKNLNEISLTPDHTDLTADVDICKSFKIWDVCQDSEADTWLTASWYTLYAYAPYDVEKNYNMYKSWSTDIVKDFKPEALNHASSNTGLIDNWWSWINGTNFYTKWNDKWILLDNVWNTWDNDKDYLKYSWLNLWDDFAIEMNVKFPMNNPNSDRYLFDFNNTLKAYFDYNYWKLFIKNSTAIFSAIDLSTYYDWMFHNIVLKNEKWNYSLYIDKNNLWTNIINNYPIYNNGSILFIWSKNDYSKQFNDIINYVKIYKKLPIVNTWDNWWTTDNYQSPN